MVAPLILFKKWSHFVQKMANKGAEMFMLESSFDVENIFVDIFYWFDVENIFVDIFYWFDKSSKRKVELEELCSFCD